MRDSESGRMIGVDILEPIQNIPLLNLSETKLITTKHIKKILSETKLIITKLIKLKNLSNITYQNKTYQLQNLSNYKTYQTQNL